MAFPTHQGQHFQVPHADTNGELGLGFALMQPNVPGPHRAREELSDGRDLPFGSSRFSRRILAGSGKRVHAIALTNDAQKSSTVSDWF